MCDAPFVPGLDGFLAPRSDCSPCRPGSCRLSREFTRVFVLLILAVWTGACSETESPPVIRWIDEAPTASSSLHELTELRPIQSWDLEEDLAGWQLSVREVLPKASSGLVRAEPTPRVTLVREVDLDAGSIDALEVELTTRVSAVRLFWAGRGERFSKEKSRRTTVSLDGSRGRYLARFEVARHQRWRGRIGRLRIVVLETRNEEVRVVAVRTLIRLLKPSTAIRTARHVEIDREVRIALLAPPRARIERDVELTGTGELRFGYGVLPGVRTPRTPEGREPHGTTFRVLVEHGSNEPELLFQDQIGEQGPGNWRDARVDLTRFRGETVRLVMENADSSLRLGAWAHPEIVFRATRMQPPNIVLISIDTLRSDRLSLNGYSRPTTPEIDAWARRAGVNFQSAVAAAPWTLPSHVSILSGLDVLTHGVDHRGRRERPPMLAELLRSSGYQTVAITGGGVLHPDFGFSRGFDRYRYWIGAPEKELDQHIEVALRLLGEVEDRPFFLLFHTYEVHEPFVARPRHWRRLTNRPLPEAGFSASPVKVDPRRESATRRPFELAGRVAGGKPEALAPADLEGLVRDLYDSGVAHADAQIGRLLRALEELTETRDTVVVLTSDHGEALGEHGLAGHLYSYDFNVLVPLVIASPDRLPVGAQIREQVRSVDILPTLLDLVGLPERSGLDGVSLLPLIDGDASAAPPEAWSYSGDAASLRIANRLKYVFVNAPWAGLDGPEQAFDIVRDPAESINVIDAQRARGNLRRRMLKRLAARPGLRLRFFSGPGGEIEASMVYPSLNAFTIRSSDLTRPVIRLVARDGRYAAELRVSSGTTCSLVLEDLGRESLALEGVWKHEDGKTTRPFEWRFTAADLLAGQSRYLVDGRWRSLAGTDNPQASIEISPQGRGADDFVPRASAELEQGLRALGYVQ